MLVLMAQMGSFVPAESMRFGLVDRIYTRIGASDNVARGRSTFMVEMTETATILNTATRALADPARRDGPRHRHLRRPLAGLGHGRVSARRDRRAHPLRHALPRAHHARRKAAARAQPARRRQRSRERHRLSAQHRARRGQQELRHRSGAARRPASRRDRARQARAAPARKAGAPERAGGDSAGADAADHLHAALAAHCGPHRGDGRELADAAAGAESARRIAAGIEGDRG